MSKKRYVYLANPLPGSLLVARTSDALRIYRSKERDERGRFSYAAKNDHGVVVAYGFKSFELLLQYLEQKGGKILVSPHTFDESRYSNLTEGERERILELRRSGLTYRDICVETGRSERTVSKTCRDWERETGEKLKKRAA